MRRSEDADLVVSQILSRVPSSSQPGTAQAGWLELMRGGRVSAIINTNPRSTPKDLLIGGDAAGYRRDSVRESDFRWAQLYEPRFVKPLSVVDLTQRAAAPVPGPGTKCVHSNLIL